MTSTYMVGAPVSHRDGSQMRRMVDSRLKSKVLLPDSGGWYERDDGLRSTLMMLVLAYWWAMHETNKGERSTEGSVKDYSSDTESTGRAKHFALSWPALADQGTSAPRAELQVQNRVLLEEVQTLRRRCQVLERQSTACEGVRGGKTTRRRRRRRRSGSGTLSESSSDYSDSSGDSDSDDDSSETNDASDTSDSDLDSHADSDENAFSDGEEEEEEEEEENEDGGTGSWAMEASLVERGNGSRDLDVSMTSGDGCDYSSGDSSSYECSSASMFSPGATGCSKGCLRTRAPFSLATRCSAGTISDSSVQVGDGKVLTEVELAEEYNLAELRERLLMSKQDLLMEQFQREVVAQEHAQLRKVMDSKIQKLEESLRNRKGRTEMAAGADQTAMDMREAKLQIEALKRSNIESKTEMDELRRKNQELVVALRDMYEVLAECQARLPDVVVVEHGNIVHTALEAFIGERVLE